MTSPFNGQTVTITFGNQGENHVGNQMIGREIDAGYTVTELKEIKLRCEQAGLVCELLELHREAEGIAEGIELAEAGLLILRHGIDLLGKSEEEDENSKDLLFTELTQLDWDKKAKMYGQVRNKHARHNLCFDHQAQEPDYESGKGRIIAWNKVPTLNRIRNNLAKWFGPKAGVLVGEGNHYYDVNKTYINLHSDLERKIVVALRIGESFPLYFQWYLRSQPIGKRFTIQLNHGDIYIMSEKAVGPDGKKRTIPTLRHAAGFPKVLKLEEQ